LHSYRQARLENAAAHDGTSRHDEAAASPQTQPTAPPGTGAPSKNQLSDHNLPMRASAPASGDDLQSIEWLMRAKTLAAGAARRGPHLQ
jgi:hypothetical protein